MPQRNSPERREELAARRQRQRTRQPGFTPMPNKRIAGYMQSEFSRLLLEAVTLTPGIQPDIPAIQQEAIRAVAAILPARGHSKMFRRRPSKSDSAVYRGIGGAGPVRQGMGL